MKVGLRTLYERIQAIAPTFPDSYPAAGLETVLKQHTMNIVHWAIPPTLRFTFD